MNLSRDLVSYLTQSPATGLDSMPNPKYSVKFGESGYKLSRVAKSGQDLEEVPRLIAYFIVKS